MDKQNMPSQDTLQSFISDGTSQAICDRYASLSEIAATADFGDLDHNIVVLDTETTGFSFHHDELTQIAAARMENGEIVEWFITFVNPGKPIPEDVAHLTDIHDCDVANAPSPSDALAELAAFVGDAKVIAHNAEFDRTFTTRHPSGYPLLENTWIDSLDLARIALPRLKSHRLLDLVRAFDLPPSTHRADADVAATCAIFRILLAGVATMPPALVCEIAHMATPDEWSTQVVFDQFAQKYENVSRETSDLKLSLRNLRRDRLGKLERTAKLDADDIAADPQRSLIFPSNEEIVQAFSETGLVGSLYNDFEPRMEQVAMAEAVRGAFSSSENLLVEAGTGVGKSMAYLVPAALTARANNIAVGVATKTNTLLDQLVYHELPALSEALNADDSERPPLTFAPLKGFSHYPCLRKIGHIVSDGAQTKLFGNKEQSQAPALAALLSFIEQTEYDDMDSLKIDYRMLPRRMVTTTANDCLRRKCPYFGTSCFVARVAPPRRGGRYRGDESQPAVLRPRCRRGAAAPYSLLGGRRGPRCRSRSAPRVLTGRSLRRTSLRLTTRVSADEASRNVFVRAERRVVVPGTERDAVLFYALTGKARAAGKVYGEAAHEFTAALKDLLFFDQNRARKGLRLRRAVAQHDIRASERSPRWQRYGRVMTAAAEKLVTTCQELVSYLEDVDGAADVQREIASLDDGAQRSDERCRTHPRQGARRLRVRRTVCRKSDKASRQAGGAADQRGRCDERNAVRAHAFRPCSRRRPLAVDDKFDAFEAPLGLNAASFDAARPANWTRATTSTPYDRLCGLGHAGTERRCLLAALPSGCSWTCTAPRLGSMLTLFTNRREMERCFDVVQPPLKTDDLRVVCQKWGVSVKGLRDDFLADEHLSLFALKSFWEGFDAPGATLKGVIIPKLPFAKPTDPLSCERAARDDQAWRRYVLPAAVLETKQAAGRLIRKADDTGVLILTDRRLLTKSYGKAFLNSLPSRTIKVMTASEIAADLERANNG